MSSCNAKESSIVSTCFRIFVSFTNKKLFNNIGKVIDVDNKKDWS